MEDTQKKALVEAPHGEQEAIKMDLLQMIQDGTDPFEIIYAVAKYLEKASAERGYAQHIIDNIHTIYGIGLQMKKPLEDEIRALENRQKRIEKYLADNEENTDITQDERSRLDFAARAHGRKISTLQRILADNKH